jgi:predicted MarR family transcription regulator
MLVLVMLVGVAMTAAVTLALMPVLTGLVDRQRAQSAADAAALAGVIGGRTASSAVAEANEAGLVAWSRAGSEVTVTVVVGGQRATARATDAP